MIILSHNKISLVHGLMVKLAFHIFSLGCKNSADTGRKLKLAKHFIHSSRFFLYFFIEIYVVWKGMFLILFLKLESKFVLRILRSQNSLFWWIFRDCILSLNISCLLLSFMKSIKQNNMNKYKNISSKHLRGTN